MDFATTDHMLTTTRTVRKRLDLTRPVEVEKIERCIEIAFQAPTAMNLQNRHFMVATDAVKRGQLAALYDRAAGQIIQLYSNSSYQVVDLRTERCPALWTPGFAGRNVSMGSRY
jgi:nitroreductase